MENPSQWIPIKRSFVLPQAVKAALKKLFEAGEVAYLVGGSVRDFLLKRTPKDYDIATSATPEVLQKLFPHAYLVGIAFGVIKIPEPSLPGKELEIATFRTDLSYQDHRHPQEVKFSSPQEDAKRRDFTVNALFYDLKQQCILDYVGGVEDLKQKTLRAIGNAQERFEEDALRMLRAVRFLYQLDFSLEQKTQKAILEKAALIQHVSFERIRNELEGVFLCHAPAQALQMFSDLGLLKYFFPELERLKNVFQSPVFHPEGDVWEHTLKAMRVLSERFQARSLPLCWGVLLHDIGKPRAWIQGGKKHFYQHEKIGANIAESLLKRFKCTNVQKKTVLFLIKEHLKFKDVFQMRVATFLRWIREEGFPELLKLHLCDTVASHGNLIYYEYCKEKLQEDQKEREQKKSQPFINGRDLIALGLHPGPVFGSILKQVEDLILEGKLQSKKDALIYVKKHFLEKKEEG